MRVALISCNGQARNAIGNQLAEKAACFHECGAEVRVFLQSLNRLHPELRTSATQASEAADSGPVWDYLVDADLVIADYAQTYELLHFLPLLAGHKPRMVFNYHGVTPARHFAGPQRTLLERSARERGFVWCAHVALAHSQFAKDELQRATGYPAERIVVESYPIDLAQFRTEIALVAASKVASGPTLLYVGRLAPSKRVPVLIKALPLLPDARAVIAGDDTDVYSLERERCLELARRLHVEDRVQFLGDVADANLPDLYRAADVLVIPSLHEGYCMPVVEAMAAGLPVVAARTTALPETVSDAGLTFRPDDAQDLARQVQRVLPLSSPPEPLRPSPQVRRGRGVGGEGALDHASREKLVVAQATPSPLTRTLSPRSTGGRGGNTPRRVAVVSFRFGSDIVGGAETSLRTIAQSLQRAGQHVEVFTTCTRHESAWSNDLPDGTLTLDGFMVHRFPIDHHDRASHHETIRHIAESDGRVADADEQAYLRHSIHSTKLIEALRRRQTEFDAIVVGPYLFGLTHDVAAAFPEQTLLLPCYHDEPFARLRCWQDAYTQVGGVLYHSPEEQEFAERVLGLNHPRSAEIGTTIDIQPAPPSSDGKPQRRYVVYCGRYSAQKNLPLLLEYAQRYDRERPGRFTFVFAGRGDVRIPEAAWASDRGRIPEEDKRRLLAHAAALIQLSRQESLSLVALEAWAQATPVIVHEDCAVLRSQVARAQGGRAIADYKSFAQALDDLWERPEAWHVLGSNGRAYVADRYGSEDEYRKRLLDAVDGLRVSMQEHMRQRGVARALERDRPRWRTRFNAFVERILHEELGPAHWSVEVALQSASCNVAAGARSLLLPVRVVNQGDQAALPEGPARTMLAAEVVEQTTGKAVGDIARTELPSLVAPGQTVPAAVTIAVPARPGTFEVMLWAECASRADWRSRPTVLALEVQLAGDHSQGPCAGAFLDAIRASLAEANRLQRLPSDYVDVTLGRFARWKLWLKQKLLGNFKKAYVDVLSHQQSQVNQHLLSSLQQLAEYCATLEHAVQRLQDRQDLAATAAPATPDTAESVSSQERGCELLREERV